jgi:hypothetical protein
MAAGKKKPEEKDGIHNENARFTRAAPGSQNGGSTYLACN